MRPAKKPPAELPSETFRRQLYEARRRSGLSQAALAERVQELGGSLHETAITRIEKGTRAVSLDDVLLLAAALGVSPTHLVVPLSDENRVRLTATERAWHAAWAMRGWMAGRDPLIQNKVEHVGSVTQPPDPGAHDLFWSWRPPSDRKLAANEAYRACGALLRHLELDILHGDRQDDRDAALRSLERWLRRTAEEIEDYIEAGRRKSDGR